MTTRTQAGDLRDKVAVYDPTAAPADGDSEAAGAATPAGASEAADREQAARAQRAVPLVDASRAVSTAEFRAPRRAGPFGVFAVAAAIVLAIVGVTLWAGLPG
jgi:hypothetical protein